MQLIKILHPSYTISWKAPELPKMPYPWLRDVDGSTTCTVVFGTLGRGHKMSLCDLH